VPDYIYRVPGWDAFPWLIHGFGTRNSDVPAEFPHLATVKQIHSNLCLLAGGRAGVIGEGDSLLENTAGSVVGIKTADCVPILLFDVRQRAVAAVHAGWRGTAAEIAKRAIEAMRREFHTEPCDVYAAIGPCIGPCCFEVGAEVSEEFGLEGRARVDLPAHNRNQLNEVGVTLDRIYASNLCTKCLAGEFYSFRRDREAAGRMYSFIGIRREGRDGVL
jgi:YfiH family protein